LAGKIATAMVKGQSNMQPVKIALGMGELLGVTHNRRAGSPSPYVQPGTIDPHLGIIRVDDMNDKPLVTLWNFAIHGICYDEFSLVSSGDIMGYANIDIENAIGGISMFMNADAGDINPIYDKVCKQPPNWVGSRMIAAQVIAVRANLTANRTTHGVIHAASMSRDFSPVQPNWTLARIDNCTSGGYMDICTLCNWLECDVDTHMPNSWWDAMPRFTAFGWELNSVKTLMVSLPGEAIVELGWWVRNDSLKLGFDQTFIMGYSNNYMGYFCTPREYLVGGYEAMLTLYGLNTAVMMRQGAKQIAEQVVFQ